MKPSLFLFFLLLGTLLSWSQTTEIASADISFHFTSKDVDGHISGFESDSNIDLANPENSVFKGSVAVKTLKSGIFLRDWSLRSGKYFDADDHPRIYFESTSVSPTTDGFEVVGNLTLKGIEKPITILFQKSDGKLVGTTTLYTSDFGIDIKKKREDNEVKVKMVYGLE